jgi:hypothetical protein
MLETGMSWRQPGERKEWRETGNHPLLLVKDLLVLLTWVKEVHTLQRL